MSDKINPINLKGKVNINKESESKKFLKTFFTGNFKDAMKYAFENVFVPYTKDAICKTSNNVISFWVNGDKPASQNVGPSRVSYWSGLGGQKTIYASSNPIVKPQSNVYTFTNLRFEDRGDAEAVLLRMKESLVTYHAVSVADLYDISGEKSNFTDYKYGWRNLDNASVSRTNDGHFIIELPRVVALD